MIRIAFDVPPDWKHLEIEIRQEVSKRCQLFADTWDEALVIKDLISGFIRSKYGYVPTFTW